MQYKQRNNQTTIVSVELIKPRVMEQVQFRTPQLPETQSLQNPVSGNGQPIAQSMYFQSQSPYTNPLNLQNATS